jgi:phosphoribosyl-AMP cyclohydrolase
MAIITVLSTRGGRCPDSTHIEIGRTPAASRAGFFIAIRMDLDFGKSDGLVTAVIQDYGSGRVLMVGYMNEEAFRQTVETGFATFYSRSRKKLWQKGETSGHRLIVKEISTDCDRDAVLLRVEPQGPGVCHNGYRSCFYRRLESGKWMEAEPRAYDPGAIYGSRA